MDGRRKGDDVNDGRRHAGANEVVNLALKDLKETLVVRFGKADPAHVRVLAESYDCLPPILVHASTMAIIDGIHRVSAAKRLRRTTVAARLFDGTEAQAFVLAVRANVSHGKPLTQGERRLAAERILRSHGDWSDRRVAEITGLSPNTVGALRKRAIGESPQLNTRIGRDGRVRPLDAAGRREEVAKLLRESGDASLRCLATRASTSVSTVADVRRRLDRGEDPLPPRLSAQRRADTASGGDDQARSCGEKSARREVVNRGTVEEYLAAHQVSEGDIDRYAPVVPLGRAYLVGDEARRRACVWESFASLVEPIIARRRQATGT